MNIFSASFRLVALTSLTMAVLAPASAQTQYPPETHAIPIPKMEDLPLLNTPFQGTAESLQKFKCPDWFRDGKFGIWAHWGPQAVAGDGDWFARHMYEEGSYPYEDHLKTYGHPSKMGYKDMIPLWKAEKWDPDALMTLYKAAGAHYFVAQAVHHDNFDNWDSTYHKWNSVNMGPHKDIVGLWQKAARKQGLPFGFSEHLGHAFDFMQASHGKDEKGPYAGVPYDGNDPRYWDLYTLPALPNTGGWYTNDPRWQAEWYARIYDVIDKYKPDLLYSDGGFPYGDAGLKIVAQLYDLSVQQHGSLQAVYCCKKNYAGTPYYDGACVQDVERGEMDDIQPFVWQTDTSTGDWYYNRADHYKTATEIIHTLMDIVSKNGNLLLNVVLYPDGSLPPEMQTFLSEMADWTKINGEAVFGTRPWTIYGEGSTRVKGGAFSEGTQFTFRDVRFTRKGSDIYCTTLGIPTGKEIVIRSLASNSPLVTGQPTRITLLGDESPVTFTRNTDGLTINLPDTMPSKSSLCFKISGLTTVDNLDAATLTAFKDTLNQAMIPGPGPDGSIQVSATDAETQGSKVKVEGDGDNSNIGWWSVPTDTVSWKMKISKPGDYEVSAMLASEADSAFTVMAGSEQLAAKALSTGNFKNYQDVDLGALKIDQAGIVTVTITPQASGWSPINVRSLTLKPKS